MRKDDKHVFPGYAAEPGGPQEALEELSQNIRELG
jgi:glycine betaine/choline ABC-type transport system substrate-binding protein